MQFRCVHSYKMRYSILFWGILLNPDSWWDGLSKTNSTRPGEGKAVSINSGLCPASPVQCSATLSFVSSFRRAQVWHWLSSPHILKDFVEIHPSLSFMYEREQYPPRVKTRKAKKWGEVWTIYIHVWNAKYKSLDIWIKRLCDKQQEQQHQQQISMPVLDSCCCKV